MKKLITILVFNLKAWSTNTVNYLQDRNGIAYKVNAEKPFTGRLLKKDENGYKAEINYKNGKKHGLATTLDENWQKRIETNYKDGQKEIEINFKDGKQHGLTTRWHENGQKEYRENFKNGKRHGLDTEWYENGQKKSEGNHKNGKQHGLWTFWHENGNKKLERNFKDGKKHGLATHWHENGQKEGEVNCKDDRKQGLLTLWHENGQKKLEICFKNDFIITLSECAKNSGNKTKESLLNKTGIYIAYPTSATLKRTHDGSKTKVNNKHTNVGITKKSFKSRSKGYHKDFNNEVVFEPLVITNLSELVEREEEILINIEKEFAKVGQAHKWFETANHERIKEIVLDTII